MNRTRVSIVSALLATAGLAGLWRLSVQRRSAFSDGDRIHEPVTGAPIRRILWQPAEPACPASAADQYEPRISADGSLMVFVRGRPGGAADLFERRRAAQGWGEATPIAAINTDHDELGPELSLDGSTLYFYSDRPGGQGGYDLWLSRSGPEGWSTPTNLGPDINTSFNEYGPALSPDGKRLYFASNRPRPGEPMPQRDAWTATIREDRGRHDYNLYMAEIGSGKAATAVADLNTPYDEGAPAISPTGDFLYFASNRPGGLGGFDVYRARLLRGTPGQPENLGRAVNSAANDLDPGLSTDGFRLYFSSDRPQTPGPEKAVERYSLWMSGSREVFIEVEPARSAEFWSALWVASWPWMVLLGLLAVLALVLRSLVRDAVMRRRLAQLSLMAKCVLVSLLIHAGILSLLAVWKVGSAIGTMLHSSGGSRVSLGSVGSGGLSTQVRGAIAPTPATIATIQSPRADLAPRSISAPNFSAELSPSSVAIVPPKLEPMISPAPAGVPLQPSPPSLTINSPEPRLPDAAQAAAPVAEATLEPSASPVPTPRGDSGLRPAIASKSIQIAPPASLPEVPPAATPDLSLSRSPASQPVSAANEPLDPTSQPVWAAKLPAAGTAQVSDAEPAAGSGEILSSPRVSSGGREISAASVRLAPAAGPGQEIPPAAAPLASTPSAPSSPPASTAQLPPAEALPGARMPTPSPSASSTMATAEPEPSVGIAVGAYRASQERPSIGAPTVHLDLPPASTAGSADTPTLALGSIHASTPPSVVPQPGLDAGLPPPSFSPKTPSGVPQGEPKTETFAQRAPEVRAEVLERNGGSQETEQAVGRALEWLKAHQSADGRWSGRHFDDACGECSGEAEIDADASMTGMALLCFLSAGHTHSADGPYREPVKRALSWLVSRQEPSGDLRRGETMHSQTIAAVALCEAFAMTRDAWLESPARRAATFVARGIADRRSDRDVSVLGWQIMAIKSADRCGFGIPHAAFDAAGRWLDRVAEPGAPGRYADRPGQTPTAAATAEALFVQQLRGVPIDQPRMKQAAEFILKTPPAWRRGAPTYYWYYATLALFQQQGEAWRRWNSAVAKELIAHQKQEGPAAGSWDPQDEWSRLGGRIYQTAVCTLSLEVYYRYAREQGPQPDPAASGPPASR